MLSSVRISLGVDCVFFDEKRPTGRAHVQDGVHPLRALELLGPVQRVHLVAVERARRSEGVRTLHRDLLHHVVRADSDDDLREVVQGLHAAGVTVVGASDHTVTHSLYIEDPDGNEIELYVDVPGVDWKTHPELVASPIKPLRL